MLRRYQNRILRLLLAFAAGFISVLLFHQGMLIFLNQINFTQFTPYPTNSTQPFGIPAILSMLTTNYSLLVLITIQGRKNLRPYIN